jgi:Spy/CpxP family protein refolding chaperone
MKTLSLIAAVLVLGSMAWSQSTTKTQVQTAPCMPPGMPGMHGNVVFHTEHGPEKWWKDSNVVKQINLTDAQAQQIEQGFYDHRLRIVDLLGESEKQEIKLQQLIDADQPDEGQINSQVEQVVAARAALEKEHASMMLNVRRVLNGEQWKKLQSIRGDHVMGGVFMKRFEVMAPPPGAPALPPLPDQE